MWAARGAESCSGSRPAIPEADVGPQIFLGVIDDSELGEILEDESAPLGVVVGDVAVTQRAELA